jgi:hypothetical protein
LPVRPPGDTGAEADEAAGAVFWASFMAEMTGWVAFELNSSNGIDNQSLGDHYAVKKVRKCGRNAGILHRFEFARQRII